MPPLRELLTAAGFGDVRTYVQSGNVVLESRLETEQLEREVERLIEQEFGLSIAVVGRTREQLGEVVARDPLGHVADNPKRYQVSFLRTELAPELIAKLNDAAVPPEQVAVHGREIYSWHAEGVARSKLWNFVASRALGTAATARNWTTVTTLLGMAGE
jgi:uncharacterized protein (DUF1697 family)